MRTLRIVAIVLLVAGALGLIYGTIRYVSDTHTMQLGSLSLSVQDHKTVVIPVWVGVGALVAGGVMLVASLKRRGSTA